MSIISVSGLIGSGKDTVAEYLISQHGYVKESFAGTLKDAVAAVFGWDREMLEGKTKEARNERETVDRWWASKLEMPHLTPRWVLQYWGTEVCRYGFHENIWIASLERKLQNMQSQNVVVCDTRFINELRMLTNNHATSVCVCRGALPNWWATAQRASYDDGAAQTMQMLGIHRSEWDWAGCSFDVTLYNNATLSELYANVDSQVLTNLELA